MLNWMVYTVFTIDGHPYCNLKGNHVLVRCSATALICSTAPAIQ